jgi:glutamate synthase (NADPH/NADH) small chain
MPMMRACAEASRPFGVRTLVSLNTIMVDGTGMCGSCRVTVAGKVKFACVDGPDFDAHQIDFDELMARQRRFRQQEQQASADHAHVCSLEDLLLRQGKRTYKKYAAVERTRWPMPERDAAQRRAASTR